MIIPATLDFGITLLCGLQGLKGNVYLVKSESEKKKRGSDQEGERECKKKEKFRWGKRRKQRISFEITELELIVQEILLVYYLGSEILFVLKFLRY